MRIPRIMITAAKSGCGKTTVTCAVLAALKTRGIRMSAAKCGPDYIDPMFHRAVLEVPSCNLDSFFTDDVTVRSLLALHAEDAGRPDLTVIEGAMGYFDGLSGISSRASAYETGTVTQTPALLVLDVKGAGISAAAEAEGFLHFVPDVRAGSRRNNGICGFLLNRVSPGFYPKLKNAVECSTGLPVLGFLPQNARLELPSRHLGLCAPEEMASQREWLRVLAGQAEKTIDLDRILEIGGNAPEIPEEDVRSLPERAAALVKERGDASGAAAFPGKKAGPRIAVARDEAFSFLYEENLRMLRMLGAEIVFFSPLRDEELPCGTGGLILPGGYPERFARELSGNERMRQSVRENIRAGLPCAAECGGFLYLLEQLEDDRGQCYPMAGVLPGTGRPRGRLVRFGYFDGETRADGLFGPAGMRLRGHEFHYWDTESCGDGMVLRKPMSGKTEEAVYYSETLAAGFPHFYYAGNPAAAAAFMAKSDRYLRVKVTGT